MGATGGETVAIVKREYGGFYQDRCRRLGTGLLWVLLAVGISAGCGGDNAIRDAETVRLDERTPEEVFAKVEERLASTEQAGLEFWVISEGAFAASLAGELTIGDRDDVRLDASGRFGADTVSVWLEGTPGGMRWGTLEESFEGGIPADLREGVVIGLTRMGVLHNLARLVSGAPPDRTDGSVRSWVEVEEMDWRQGDSGPGEYGLSFRIRVGGERAGRAVVWLDSEGEMVGRDQVVEFPGGEMRVEERYRWK
jgi:hypothetical protein